MCTFQFVLLILKYRWEVTLKYFRFFYGIQTIVETFRDHGHHLTQNCTPWHFTQIRKVNTKEVLKRGSIWKVGLTSGNLGLNLSLSTAAHNFYRFRSLFQVGVNWRGGLHPQKTGAFNERSSVVINSQPAHMSREMQCFLPLPSQPIYKIVAQISLAKKKYFLNTF